MPIFCATMGGGYGPLGLLYKKGVIGPDELSIVPDTFLLLTYLTGCVIIMYN